MSGRARLLEEIRRTQDQGTADQVAEARARLFASPAPRRQPWAMGLAAGLVGALFIAAALWGGAPAPEVRLVGSEEALPSAWISVPPDSTQPFAFSDGTVVIAAPGARARVLTTSANAVVAKKGSLAYDTSKAAANHLVRELAVELSPLVRVNAVAPATVVKGSTMFPRERVISSLVKYAIAFSEDEATEALRDKLAQFYAQRTLTQTPIEPIDQAEAIFLLVSPRLAKTTGHVIPVDGGLQDGFLR